MGLDEMVRELHAAERRAETRPAWRRWLWRDPEVMRWPCDPVEGVLDHVGRVEAPRAPDSPPLMVFRLSQVRDMRRQLREAAHADGVDIDIDV
jgi:hypothetical protein